MLVHQRQGKDWTREEIEADNARVAAKPLTEPEPVLPAKPNFRKAPRTFKMLHEALPALPSGDATTAPEIERCKRCNGAGFYTPNVPMDDPRFGKPQKCDAPNCPHVKRDRLNRVATFFERMGRHFGNKPEHYENATLADLTRPELRHNPIAVQAAQLFIDRRPMITADGVDKYSLIFTSAMPGTGKTYLASIIYNELKKRGELAWFNTVRTMLKAVQTGYSDSSEMRSTEVEDALCNAPFLFIDELEINKASGDKIDILEAIINTRMLAKMPTVITTNLSQKTVGDVWNFRIQSRLLHVAWWINMGDKSLRDKSGEIPGGER